MYVELIDDPEDLFVDSFYINDHSRVRTSPNLRPGDVTYAYTVMQVGKNGLGITHQRLVIPNGRYYCIANLYRHKESDRIYAKALTMLSESQLRSSRNMNCGKPLGPSYRITIGKILQEEKFFDYKQYEDFLN